jgi:hypothetical protein
MSFSVVFSIGKYGGFYFGNGETMKRLVLGWIAFTFVMPEYDETFMEIIEFNMCEQNSPLFKVGMNAI